MPPLIPRAAHLAVVLVVLLVACTAPQPEQPGPDTAEPPPADDAPPPSDAEMTVDDRAGWPEQLVLGLAPARDADVLAQAADPLRAALASALAMDVAVAVPESDEALRDGLASGAVHVAALAALPAVQHVDRHGGGLAAQLTRAGGPTFHTQWFTTDVAAFCGDEPQPDAAGLLRCNGAAGPEGPVGQEALRAAAGRTVAFVAETSASGFLFPWAQLAEEGVTDVQPLFTGGHDAAVRAVADGAADVGVSFDDARLAVRDQVPDVGQRVVVFATTAEVPHDVLATAANVPDSLRVAIGEGVIAFAASQDGAAVLNAIYGMDGAAPPDPEAFGTVRAAVATLGVELQPPGP